MTDLAGIDLGPNDGKRLKPEKQNFTMWCMCGKHHLKGDVATDTYICEGCNLEEDSCECA